MEVYGQNNVIKRQSPQTQAGNTNAQAPATVPAQTYYTQPRQTAYQTPVVQQQTQTIPAQQPVQQQSYPHGYLPVQNTAYPPSPQPQTYQVPASASGVNIQIFNPSVTTPGAQAPTYNVNAPCYPSAYYTGQIGPDGKMHTGTGTNTGGENINTNTNTNTNINSTDSKKDEKKTEKRKIVQLTDDYIRNLETYLNSQEKEVRLSAAKEVYARLEEDDSRKDDKALTALINKMLQDPSTEIRIMALSALENRMVTGDDYTVGVLQKMQQNPSAYGQDAVDATNILLKMSGKEVEKEFEVKDKPKKADDKKTDAKK